MKTITKSSWKVIKQDYFVYVLIYAFLIECSVASAISIIISLLAKASIISVLLFTLFTIKQIFIFAILLLLGVLRSLFILINYIIGMEDSGEITKIYKNRNWIPYAREKVKVEADWLNKVLLGNNSSVKGFVLRGCNIGGIEFVFNEKKQRITKRQYFKRILPMQLLAIEDDKIIKIRRSNLISRVAFIKLD